MSTHTASYKELLAQRTALEQQIAAARESELSGALQTIRTLIETFGLTPADIFSPAGQKKRGAQTIAPKYRDPATGATWTGRGKPPAWIKNQDRARFVI
jgi:DNA-binding protein H-NS